MGESEVRNEERELISCDWCCKEREELLWSDWMLKGMGFDWISFGYVLK